jgi:hypothetical protein
LTQASPKLPYTAQNVFNEEVVMRWSTVLTLALAAALVACGPQQLSRQELAVEEAALEQQVQLWERSVNSVKPDSMALAYEHSPAFSAAWPDGMRTRGWDEEEAAQREFTSRTSAYNFDVQDPVIEILAPNVAVTTFSHTTDVADSLSGRALYSGRGTIVWVKDPADKIWKIHTLQVSRTPAPAQPAGRRR